jgi:rubrerythrin
METKSPLDILKMAILMEMRGFSFYTKVVEQTKDDAIANVFSIMAQEENLHIKYLSEQFSNFEKNKSFSHTPVTDSPAIGITKLILSEEMKNKISAAGFEAAAISAAIDMEKKAIEVYSHQAEISKDPNEKKLYKWLADWEQGHLKVLSELDNELRDKIWFDNHFWPF